MGKCNARNQAIRDLIVTVLRAAQAPRVTREIENATGYPNGQDVYRNLRALEGMGVVERAPRLPYSQHVSWQLTAAERAKDCNAEFEALVAQLDGGDAS